jgi:hypothetical protein
MASTPVKKSEKTSEVELHHDAWERFERAAGVVAKSPPQHRGKPKAKRAKIGEKLKQTKKK